MLHVALAAVFLIGGICNLFSREGRYDAESNKIMTVSSIFGIVVGAMMFMNLFGLTDIPFVPFI
ncbi:MAG: hypothetical protein M3R04_06870 [bacterium]|nr:hypothetical protein [bacterium]